MQKKKKKKAEVAFVSTGTWILVGFYKKQKSDTIQNLTVCCSTGKQSANKNVFDTEKMAYGRKWQQVGLVTFFLRTYTNHIRNIKSEYKMWHCFGLKTFLYFEVDKLKWLFLKWKKKTIDDFWNCSGTKSSSMLYFSLKLWS